MRLLSILLLIGFISCKNDIDSSTLIYFRKVTYDAFQAEYFIGYDTINFDLSIKNNQLDTTGLIALKFIISKNEFDMLTEFIFTNNAFDSVRINADSLALYKPKLAEVEVYNIDNRIFEWACIEEDCTIYFNQMINLLTDNPSEGAQNLIHTITERREFEF